MNVSEQINKFIAENGGSERDALNVALARLEKITQENNSLKDRLDEAIERGDFWKERHDKLNINHLAFPL